MKKIKYNGHLDIILNDGKPQSVRISRSYNEDEPFTNDSVQTYPIGEYVLGIYEGSTVGEKLLHLEL